MIYKRAQMSLFIIIAVILIFLFVLIFALIDSPSLNFFQDERPSYQIEEFVESCIVKVSDDGIQKLGLTGGWLYSDGKIFADRHTPKQLIQRADGFKDPGNVEMPYWYYYDDSSEEFRFNVPELATDSELSMKNQLARYVEENINTMCIQNFEIFEEVYDIEFDISELEVIAEMDRDDIIVSVNWPLNINIINEKGSSEYIEFYSEEFENKLYEPYYLAREITRAESQSSFVEKRILSFLNPYQSTQNKSLLPPFYDFSLSYDFEPWDVRKVEILTKQIIASHISKIQFLNTNYVEEQVERELQTSEFARGLNTVYIKDYLTEGSTLKEEEPSIFRSFRDYSVTPYYDSYIFPTFFSLDPSLGDIILLPRPEAVISILPVFFTEYTAVYQMTGPVIFEIRNSNSQNDDFVFNLPLEFNIDHNTPLQENYAIPEGLGELIEEASQGSSLICDPTQFTSAPINVSLYDPINKGLRDELTDPVTGVNGAFVEFDCKGITTCYVGETQKDPQTGETNLLFQLPEQCSPGTIIISQPGYERVVLEDVNPSQTPIDLGVQRMSSSKQVAAQIKIVEDNPYSVGRSLSSSETGFIIFEHKQTEDFTRVLEITDESQYNLSIELLPGNYSVEGFILYNDETQIPSEEICYDDSPLNPFDDDECVVIPQINLSSWVSAGIEIDNFFVNEDSLVLRDTLVIPLRDFGVPQTFDQLQESSDVLGDLAGRSLEPYLADD